MFFIVIPLKNSKLKTVYPWRIPKFQAQNLSPLKNSKLKTFYPWRIPSSKPFTPEEFQAQNPLPQKNSKLWKISISNLFTPEEFQAQNTLPLKNSKLKTLYPWRIPSSKHFIPEEFQGSSTGGVRILNGIAHYPHTLYGMTLFCAPHIWQTVHQNTSKYISRAHVPCTPPSFHTGVWPIHGMTKYGFLTF
jgi:hypothetical protein